MRETIICNCYGRTSDDYDPDCCEIHSHAKRKAAPHVHVPTYFATPTEHDRRLTDGAIRCMTQLLERTRGREPSVGFRHVLSALLEGMEDLQKEIDVESK